VIWLIRIVSCLFLCGFFWLASLLWYVSMMPSKPAASDMRAEAIVVLTGGKGRLEEGFRRLADGAAPMLFISGVGHEVRIGDLTRNLPDDLQKKLRTLPAKSIVLGNKARNTIGNAEETMAWLQDHPKTSVLLVTSHYHMPRSLSEFHALMPGLLVVPIPVVDDDFTNQWWRDDKSRELALSEYHKYVASKLRHWFMYATGAIE
jgi:uncharacterized SAM-binding protein YcdF (DUF218 family)